MSENFRVGDKVYIDVNKILHNISEITNSFRPFWDYDGKRIPHVIQTYSSKRNKVGVIKDIISFNDPLYTVSWAFVEFEPFKFIEVKTSELIPVSDRQLEIF